LRLRTTSSLLARRDVIVVCSVSAIYGLGNPRTFKEGIVHLRTASGWTVTTPVADGGCRLRPQRHGPGHGDFRVRGDVVEVRAAHEERTLRIEFFGEEIERLAWIEPLTGHTLERVAQAAIFPASQFILTAPVSSPWSTTSVATWSCDWPSSTPLARPSSAAPGLAHPL